MKLEIAKLIVDSAEKLDLEVKLREGYSGRGMFGKTTAGIVGSKASITKATAYAAYRFGSEDLPEIDEDLEIEEFLEELDFSWDSMGRDEIAY